MKYFLLILFLLFCFDSYSQSTDKVKRIVTFNYGDTLSIEEFNTDGNLIFHKIFPQYGVSQILGYEYEGKKKISYTWSHSNIGFIESEYEYDSSKNTVSEYSYSRMNMTLPDLMRHNSISSLKNTKAFKKYLKPETRYLKKISFLKDSLIIKEKEFGEDNTLKFTSYFSYENGLLVKKKKVNASTKKYEELIYDYNKDGNEIYWAKVYNSRDTSVVYKKSYKDSLLIEETGFVRDELSSVATYTYTDGKLSEKIEFDSKGDSKIISKYNYNENGTINFINETNNYMGQQKKIIYIYF